MRVNALSGGGALTATVVGTVAIAAGWRWGILLAAFFVSSITLSRFGRQRRAESIAGIVAKSGARDLWQVLANGGIFAAAAAAAIVSPYPGWRAVGVGALAASTADTWATEIGTLVGGRPRSILSGERIPIGASGGITPAGSIAAVAGAAFMAVIAGAIHWEVPILVILLSGVAGALADSVLGALVQERFWCEACAAPTEQPIHRCGTITSRAGGFAGLDNDVVNLVCSAVGALIALLMA